MLLKSIKLVNFRQFINESIDFAEGKGGKNVTIILGENGTGKTTFAQTLVNHFAKKNLVFFCP